MNKTRLILNKIMKAKYFVGLFFIGLFFLVGGIITMNLQDNASIAATATIESIDPVYDASLEKYEYTVVLHYTDEDGNVHVVTTNSYSSSWKEGKTISIKYNPNDYDDISFKDTAFLPYLLLAVGALAMAAGAVKVVLVLVKKTSDENEFNRVNLDEIPQEKIEEVRQSDEPQKNYIFHFTQGLKTSYIMKTDPAGEVIYEAQSQKLSVVTKYQYNFINHKNGKEEMKICSHTVTTSYGEGNVELPTDSHFEINDKLCWNVLGEAGYSLEPHITGLHHSYDVLKYGVKVGYFENAGTNAATGKDYKMGEIATPGIYKVSARESDIDGVFLACFIVARTYDL